MGDVTEGDTITEEISPVETITKLREFSIMDGGASERVSITVVGEDTCPMHVVVDTCSKLLAVEAEEEVTAFVLVAR